MKGVKIVLLLAGLMILSTVSLLFVQYATQPAITEREQKAIADALDVVIPGYKANGYTADEFTSADRDFGISGIEKVFEVKDSSGNLIGYAYTVAFQGYSSTIKYIFATDLVGQLTGYVTLSQNDTSGFGAQIADPANWEQFNGMLFSDAGAGSFDGLSGASITTGKWKASWGVVYDYHKATYGEPNQDDILNLKKSQLVPDGATLTAVELTDQMINAGITSADVASIDNKDVAVVFVAEFSGYQDGFNRYLVSFDIETEQVIAYVHDESGDTEEYGGQVMQTSYWATFEARTAEQILAGDIDSIAGTSNAPVTTEALRQSLIGVSISFFNNYTSTPRLSYNEKVALYSENLFPTATEFIDVTVNKEQDFNIKAVYDAYNGETYLGTVYNAVSVGMLESDFVIMEMLVGIDASKNFTGTYLLETNGVLTYQQDQLFQDASFTDVLNGTNIEGAYTLGTVTNFEVVTETLSNALDKAVNFHLNKYYSFIEVDNADLLQVFPTAATFESVYADMTIVPNIGNIYVAKDATDTVLGYVYYRTSSGFGGTIEFIYGIDAAGTTGELIILSDNESWSNSGYGGSEGNNFTTSSWLDYWTGEAVADLLTGGASEVDVVGGVSTTTAAMKTALIEILEYHDSENVGGAN